MDIHKATSGIDNVSGGVTMVLMVERNRPNGKKKDLHKYKGLLLRLPPIYREQLGRAAKKNRRSLTEQAKIAFEQHLEAEGFWPPDSAPSPK